MSRTNQIYFDHPGDFGLWEQTCLPIGNGYMGASMFGGIEQERVVLNEKDVLGGRSLRGAPRLLRRKPPRQIYICKAGAEAPRRRR